MGKPWGQRRSPGGTIEGGVDSHLLHGEVGAVLVLWASCEGHIASTAPGSALRHVILRARLLLRPFIGSLGSRSRLFLHLRGLGLLHSSLLAERKSWPGFGELRG